MSICRLVFLICFLSIHITVLAQKKLGLQPDKWAIILTKNKLNEVNSLGSLTQMLIEADSLRAFHFLDSLDNSSNAKGYYFRIFFNMVKADFLYAKFAGYDKYKDRRSIALKPIKEQLIKLYSDAIDAVYHIENDDILIGWVSFYSARKMRYFGETAWAVMYSQNGVELFEKQGYSVEPHVYTELAELLYQVEEYDECIINAKKGITAWGKMNYDKDIKDPYKYKIDALNTMGNSFYKTNRPDSALACYQQALLSATENKDTVRAAKVLGNIGRVLYAQNNFDSAYSLFKTNYQISKKDSIYNEAANASLWMAKTNLARGNKAVALAEVREAIPLLGLWPNGPYLRDTYYTLIQVFKSMKNYDSAFFYNDRYFALNDSLEKEVATSSIAIAKAKLNDKTSRYKIQNLNKQKSTQLLIRNIIIAAIVFLSVLAILLLNRQRLKEMLKTIKIEQEKQLLENEIASAKEQMQMFTFNIIEKTNLIENLEQQMQDNISSAGQQETIAVLSNLTILTEVDWSRFKELFEKMYPMFFQRLKTSAPDITVAEQRMAALTRLQLTTRQMASMQGISPDSVHKTRQRLRQRLGVSSETNLEEYLGSV
jgi:tetratricopeptide (TPR) repeat protein/DNA-binding CsgD family transcriptional regulator